MTRFQLPLPEPTEPERPTLLDIDMPEEGIRSLILFTGGEKYVLSYNRKSDESVSQSLKQLGRWASNPRLIYTWYDAAVMSQKIRSGT